MNTTNVILDKLRALLFTQRFAVLATTGGGEPHASLVAFVVMPELKELVFATTRATRKFANLREQPVAAMLVDDRGNRAADVRDAMAVTAMGAVTELAGAARTAAVRQFLDKHPELAGFLAAPTTSVCGLTVARYQVVDQFQRVTVLEMGTVEGGW